MINPFRKRVWYKQERLREAQLDQNFVDQFERY